MVASVVLIVAGLSIAGAGDEVWMWVVGLAFAAPGFGIGETASLGYLLEVTGPSRMILAMAVWNQVFSIGYLVGPAVGGAVADAFGFDAVGLLPLVIGAAVLGVMLRLPRQSKPLADLEV